MSNNVKKFEEFVNEGKERMLKEKFSKDIKMKG
jgi:hypothetical protein